MRDALDAVIKAGETHDLKATRAAYRKAVKIGLARNEAHKTGYRD